MPLPGVCMNIMKERQKGHGVGTLTSPKQFLEQDYEFLHQYHLAGNWRFIDDMFPPEKSSIGENLLSASELARVEWIRPTKLVPNPYLIVDDVSRFDFAQGKVGNCWFLAAVGALTFQKDVLKNVFPEGQSFQKDYAGIFHFRFWRFGKWVDVVIDDKLPTINGQLIFTSPKTHNPPSASNEFWPALLEKAYAKVCGSYSDMKFGWVSEALKDFTGGVCVTLNPNILSPVEVWERIHFAGQVNSMMGCGTPGQEQVNGVLSNGLVEGHAYAVTGASKVVSHGNLVHLVRLFNPWGWTEWKGDWSDNSHMWNTVRADDQGLRKVVEDGEFWMSVEDFCRSFCQLDICSSSPAFLDGSSKSQWTSNSHEGQWLAGSTAGGCMDNKGSFWTNPKFQVTVKASEPSSGLNVLVSLMQKPDKRSRRLTRKLHIGFNIFQLPPDIASSKHQISASFFNSLPCVVRTTTLFDSREVTNLCTLALGEYLIVPYTYHPNQSAFFHLCVWSKSETHLEDVSNLEQQFNQMQVNSAENQKVQMERQISVPHKEINVEQLQRLLNARIGLSGEDPRRGFSIDACQSMIAMMDLSVTGTLNAEELRNLLYKVDFYKDLFYHMDKNRDAILSQTELQSAVEAAGFHAGSGLLKLLSLRFADPSGRITLEKFICLALRLRCMSRIFRKLGDGHKLHLAEHEWLYLTMYS